MQIHELNNFTGTLGSGAYLAIDDGTDTGKISSQGLLAATEARIDNIIAGPAPSAQEVTDARLGADGVVYPSLGDAIRDQVTDLKSDLNNSGVAVATSVSATLIEKASMYKISDNYYVVDATSFTNPDTYTIKQYELEEGAIYKITTSSERSYGFSNSNIDRQSGTLLSLFNKSVGAFNIQNTNYKYLYITNSTELSPAGTITVEKMDYPFENGLKYLDYISLESYSQYANDKIMYVGAFESGGFIKLSSPYPWAKFYIYNLDGTFNSVVGNDNDTQREATLPSSGSIVFASVYNRDVDSFDITNVEIRISNIKKYSCKYSDTLSDAHNNTVAKTVSEDAYGKISYTDSTNRVTCTAILQGDNISSVRCSDKYKILNYYFNESTMEFDFVLWDNVQQTDLHSINLIVVKKADGSNISASDLDELERDVIFIKDSQNGDFQTIYIASKDAPSPETSKADIVCDGTDDVAKINRALKYFELFGISGTIKFSQGKFIINDAYKSFSDTDKYLNVFGIKSEYPQRNITFEGTNPPIRKYGVTGLQLNNTAVFSMTQSLYESIQDDGYLMMFTCLQNANTGAIAYPKLSMNIKNIAIEIPNNKKPIMLIDGKFASNMSVSNVIGCATLSNYSSGYHPEDVGIEKCIGIRGLDGMNFGEGYRLDNIFMYYMGIGFSLGGEHLIAQNLGTYGCYINYGMGLYGSRPSVHPNTLINCCGEQGVNDWVFGSNPYKQHISIIDYNMERMNNWPMNRAVERDLQNRFCGHITFQAVDGDVYTNNPNAEFWQEGYGEYFDTTNLTAVFNN